MSQAVIRPMRESELPAVIEWAAAEGWEPGLADAESFWAADPGGYLVAEDSTGLVGSVSVVRYSEQFAFAGFFLARTDRRGVGIGHRLVEAAVALAGDRTIGLDGVVAQQEHYREMGFEFSHRSIRHQGVPVMGTMPAEAVPIGPHLVDAVIAADARWFGAHRATFLRSWLNGKEGRSGFAVVDGQSVLGYAVVRPSRSGHRIGPLFAVSDDVAEILFCACVASIGTGPLALDVPEPNTGALSLAERHGLAPIFETARMYRGPALELPVSEVYGITTFELG